MATEQRQTVLHMCGHEASVETETMAGFDQVATQRFTSRSAAERACDDCLFAEEVRRVRRFVA